MLNRLKSDVACILDRDPAARSWWEVLTCYPGLHAIYIHRLAHWFWTHNLRWPGRFTSHLGRWLTGIEIHPGAKIGRCVFIDHGLGVVIGETAEVGDGCTIYQGVTLGGTSLSHGKRHPTLESGVTVGVNSAVLGDITVGANSKIGGGSVVVKDVPPNSTVVGVPARIVMQNGVPVRAVPDRPQVDMPDPTADAIAKLQRRVEQLEDRLHEFEQQETGESAWSWVI